MYVYVLGVNPSGGLKILMLIYVIVENHWLCKFKYGMPTFNMPVCVYMLHMQKDKERF